MNDPEQVIKDAESRLDALHRMPFSQLSGEERFALVREEETLRSRIHHAQRALIQQRRSDQ